MQKIKNTLREMKNVFYELRKRLVGEKYKWASRQVRRNYPKWDKKLIFKKCRGWKHNRASKNAGTLSNELLESYKEESEWYGRTIRRKMLRSIQIWFKRSNHKPRFSGQPQKSG